MEIYCTTCCKEKNRASGEIPAIERYLSPRIAAIYAKSEQAGVPFRILSGKYGLLSPETPIPWYDKKLEAGEVDMMIPVITAQLEKEHIRKMIFFRRDLPEWTPYTLLLRNACRQGNILLEEIILGDTLPE